MSNDKKIKVTEVDPKDVPSDVLERLSKEKPGTVVWDDVTKH
jgi:hypothetical protein